MKRFVAILLLLAGFASVAARAADADARIVEWSGAVVLQTKKGAKGRALSPSDLGWRLRAGDTLQIPANGAITLALPAETKTIRGPEKFTVPAAASTAVRPLLLKDFSPAATRSAENGILDPAADGALRAETATLRWVPAQWRGLLRLQITDPARRKLWSRDAVPAGDGSLADPALRTALTDFATAHGAHRARLSVSDESGKTHEVEFTVLTPAEEKQLAKELAESAAGLPEKSWATAASRAAILAAHGFFYEAAVEAERAADLAPKNRELTREASARWREAGDAARAAKLLQRATSRR